MTNQKTDTKTSTMIEAISYHVTHDDLETLSNWLCEIFACRRLEHVDGADAVVLDGPSGLRCGFLSSDPITNAVQIGFAIAGDLWPHVFPGMLELVNKKWKAKLKGKKDE